MRFFKLWYALMNLTNFFRILQCFLVLEISKFKKWLKIPTKRSCCCTWNGTIFTHLNTQIYTWDGDGDGMGWELHFRKLIIFKCGSSFQESCQFSSLSHPENLNSKNVNLKENEPYMLGTLAVWEMIKCIYVQILEIIFSD